MLKASSLPPRGSHRLLFLLPFPPRLDAAHGGARVIAQFLASLSTRHRVVLLYLQAADEPEIDSVLRERCEMVEKIDRPILDDSKVPRRMRFQRPFMALLVGKPSWVMEWSVAAYRERAAALLTTWCPDIIQVEFHIMGQYIPDLGPSNIPIVLVEHEPGTQAARDQLAIAHGPARMRHLLNVLAWKRYERALFRKVAAIVVFTDRDREAVQRMTRGTPVKCIPLGVALPDHPLNPQGRTPCNILFVGNFMHPPNADAALRLVRAIFPAVQKKIVDVTLLLVGGNPTPEMIRANGENITVSGQVPDVRPYLDAAAVVVIPLRLGGGMRVKVLEALAAGKAIVASARAVEGLNIVDGKHFDLAESDAEFVEAVSALLFDSQRRTMLAQNARAWAVRHLEWQASVQRYETLYESLIE